MGQVNLVRFGLDHLTDGGAFVLTSGMFSLKPIRGVAAIAMANGGVEAFARGAAVDLAGRARVVVISPPFVAETAERMGMPTGGKLAADELAKSYLDAIEGRTTHVVVRPEP